MAFSPIGRDQVLSLALTEAAGNLERGQPVEGDGLDAFLGHPDASEADRLEIRRRVFQSAGTPAAVSERVAENLERRYRPECATPSELSERLSDDAKLHELLWDEPRLLCDDRTRLVMLLSVPKLLERAEQLDPTAVRVHDEQGPGPAGERSGGPSRRRARAWLRRKLFGSRSAMWLLPFGIALFAASGGALIDA
jgi:hypothetical protein